MSLVVVGVDHSTCPVSIREPMALEGPADARLMRTLMTQPSIDEAAVVSTCARIETYLWSASDSETAAGVASEALTRLNPDSAPFVKIRTDNEAVAHAFRVTAGLESQIIGETEITGQVRIAVQHARTHGSLGPNLQELFRAALACSRRLRRETALGATGASVAAAVATIFRQSQHPTSPAVLILGSGKIAHMLVDEFAGLGRVVIAARNPASAAAIASRADIESLNLSEAIETLPNFDVVCCATRSRAPLLTVEDVQAAAPITVFDVSVPRNVDPHAAAIAGVTLYDVDAVSPDVDRRTQGAQLIESILAAEVHDYTSRGAMQEVGPIIAALREHVDHVRAQELERLQSKLDSLDPAQRAVIETMTQRLIDRMFHHLVTRLKLAALTDPDLIKAADFFFAHGEDSLFPTRSESDQTDETFAPSAVLVEASAPTSSTDREE